MMHELTAACRSRHRRDLPAEVPPLELRVAPWLPPTVWLVLSPAAGGVVWVTPWLWLVVRRGGWVRPA